VPEPYLYGLLISLVKYELKKLYFGEQTGSSLFKEGAHDPRGERGPRIGIIATFP
jgi:hypothetical protein